VQNQRWVEFAVFPIARQFLRTSINHFVVMGRHAPPESFHRTFPELPPAILLMPENGQQDNDWQRHAKQPQENTATKAHLMFL
jgi:hypothetical protein